MTTAEFLIAAAVVAGLVLAGSATGRYLLRRVVLGLAAFAAVAVLVLDGRSPF